MKKYRVLFFIVSVVVPIIFGIYIWKVFPHPFYALIGGIFLDVGFFVFLLISKLEVKKENKNTVMVFKIPIKEENKKNWLDAFEYTKEVYEQVILIDVIKDQCIIQKNVKEYSSWLMHYVKENVYLEDKENFLRNLSLNSLREESFKCRLLSKGKFRWFLIETYFTDLKDKEALVLFKNINKEIENEFRINYSKLCLESQLFKVYNEILELDLSKNRLYRIEVQKANWVRSLIFEDIDAYIKNHVFPSDYEKCKNLYPREIKIRIRKNKEAIYQWYLISFRKVVFQEGERVIVYLKNIQNAWVCEEIRRKQIQRALERRA